MAGRIFLGPGWSGLIAAPNGIGSLVIAIELCTTTTASAWLARLGSHGKKLEIERWPARHGCAGRQIVVDLLGALRRSPSRDGGRVASGFQARGRQSDVICESRHV